MKNRTIKFRGLAIDGSGWKYGFYFQDLEHEGKWKHSIYEDANFIPVIPETVSQFTGLIDMDGCDVYFDDVIEWNDGTYIKPRVRIAVVVQLKGEVGFMLTDDTPTGQSGYVFNWGIFAYGEEHIKVTGNIHEQLQ